MKKIIISDTKITFTEINSAHSTKSLLKYISLFQLGGYEND